MPTIFISGAASGLGWAFLQHYATDINNHILAIDLAQIKTENLRNLRARIRTARVDITSQASLNSLFNDPQSSMSDVLQDIPIDLMIHCIGIRGLVPSIEEQFPNDVARAETMDVMDEHTMAKTFNINVIGTFSLMRRLMENLRRASTPATPARVVIMGSRMGSMSANTAGSAYAYRASKAALNAVIKSFSIDVPEVIFITLHPGRVETGLVKCREEGAIEPEESVDEMVRLVSSLDKADTGSFMDRFGDKIDW